MTTCSVSTACVLVVVLTACGPDGGGKEVASGPGAPPSASSVATPPSPSAAPVRSPGPSPGPTGGGACRGATSYEDAARCLYDAFRAQDQQTASRYATPEAVEALFALRDAKPDQWTFHGCDGPGEFDHEPARVCHFQIPYDVHPTYVQMAMSVDHTVEEVITVG